MPKPGTITVESISLELTISALSLARGHYQFCWSKTENGVSSGGSVQVDCKLIRIERTPRLTFNRRRQYTGVAVDVVSRNRGYLLDGKWFLKQETASDYLRRLGIEPSYLDELPICEVVGRAFEEAA